MDRRLSDRAIPTSRDVRIRITPLAESGNPRYFGNEAARIGLTSGLLVRTAAAAEAQFYVPAIDADAIHGIMLQPGVDSSDLTQRLAQPLDVLGNDLTLAARPGTPRCIWRMSGAALLALGRQLHHHLCVAR